MSVIIFKYEVRHYLLNVFVRVIIVPSRRRIETQYPGHRFFKVGFRHPCPRENLLKMLVGKFLKIILKYILRIHYLLCLLAGPKLKKKALPQIPGSDTGRLEILDNLEYGKHFRRRGLDSGAKSHVIHQRFHIPAKIAVIVQRTYQKRSNFILTLVQIAAAELVHQFLVETFLYGKRIILRPGILAPIVDMGLIGRNIVIILYFVYGNILRFFRAIRVRTVIKDRILLDFTANLLLQTLHRQFKKLDCQNLKRRHLLCLLYFKTLLYHSSSSIILLMSDLPIVG
ncbi:unknown [Bacteroides sp. CAG:1060]|nr:unknown [Bacteroides sp. CAG:1060]